MIKKLWYRVTGKVALSDPVRDHVYLWAWEHLRQLPSGARVVDIGSRDSPFPAFLAWRGCRVRIIERDARFTALQETIGRRWGVPLIIDNCDFPAATVPGTCNAICSLFGIQYAGDEDVPSYRRVARLLENGGLFLSATEYRHEGTRSKKGRSDGTIRIYGAGEIEDRIKKPLTEEGMTEVDRRYLTLSDRGDVDAANGLPGTGTLLLLLFRKG